MAQRSLVLQLQADRLHAVHDLGVADEDLVVHARRLGQPIADASVIRHFRKGDRTASIGWLHLILGAADEVRQPLILDQFARPYGLRVVPDEDLASDARGPQDRLLAVVAAVGELAAVVRSALADDGDFDAEERSRTRQVLEAVRSEVVAMDAILAAGGG